MTMLRKTINTFAAAAILGLGAASAVQASDTDRNDIGGFRIGPLGQSMGGSAVNPVYHRSLRGAGRAYAYVVPNADNVTASCEQRFRSFDPVLGTYLGFDGLRHPCP
jgi:hypothetical protein